MSKEKLPPGVYAVRKRLKSGQEVVYYYDRRSKKRIEGNPGSSRFTKNLNDARRAPRPAPVVVHEPTVSDLIAKYRKSQEYAQVTEETKVSYERHLRKIHERFGTLAIAGLEDRGIRDVVMEWRDELSAASLRQADYSVQVFNLLAKFGYDRGLIGYNHLSGIKRLYKGDRTDLLWEPEHVEKLTKHAYLELLWVVAFGAYTGQRIRDLLLLRRDQMVDGEITLRQSKSRRVVHIPVHRDLKRVIETIPENAYGVFLTTKRRKPWEIKHFQKEFWEVKAKAGLGHMHFHDFRGTAVTRLAEAGCTHPEIAAITGHSLKTVQTILEHYLSRTRALAQSAMRKLETAENHMPANWLLTVAQQAEKQGFRGDGVSRRKSRKTRT